MKIRKRPITAADDLSVNRCTFTPEDVAAFLSQIYELQGLGISLNEKAIEPRFWIQWLLLYNIFLNRIYLEIIPSLSPHLH